eukprot:CAMPEP_0197031164 /NCGR_PEP_ID=MMETSP1384-20130603/10249_1 /TAXON_ID=29189 /ORGANISM="Ammonia sp." /LENGTH=125 /DNA_ID=CAMNT_0042460655 /DNA_START=26 /DNA_END=400 /DNA_ORIENTATION=-
MAAEAKQDEVAAKASRAQEVAEKAKDLIGGFYVDPNHFLADGTFAGTRTVSDWTGDAFTIHGCDDGVKWWTVPAKWVDRAKHEITADFSKKGAPLKFSDMRGIYKDGGITWQDAQFMSSKQNTVW